MSLLPLFSSKMLMVWLYYSYLFVRYLLVCQVSSCGNQHWYWHCFFVLFSVGNTRYLKILRSTWTASCQWFEKWQHVYFQQSSCLGMQWALSLIKGFLFQFMLQILHMESDYSSSFQLFCPSVLNFPLACWWFDEAMKCQRNYCYFKIIKDPLVTLMGKFQLIRWYFSCLTYAVIYVGCITHMLLLKRNFQ